MIALVEGDGPVRIDDMLVLMQRHLVSPPVFLPLAARCFGLMAHSVPPAAALAFRGRMAGRLERAGAGLERHFPELVPGEGVALLRRSYALIIGLWQMSATTARGEGCAIAGDGKSPGLAWSYPAEVDYALRRLWRGSVGGEWSRSDGAR